MIKRDLLPHLVTLATRFKAVLVTGPRQSGKTTLVRSAFPHKPYVSLEDPDERLMATEDPRSFLGRFPHGAILDEAQRVPMLFSYLLRLLDESQQMGLFIITGSQHLGLIETVSQSLAGRVAVLELLPFSRHELTLGRMAPQTADGAMFLGGYPPLYDQKPDAEQWLNSYIATYLERDVRTVLNVRNMLLFQRFLALCAANTGQLFNAARVGADCGVNAVTVSQWLSVLEATYVTYRIQPHISNYRKRVVKTPKFYFCDTGLAVRLLGIETPGQLATHPLRGMLFENWVISELLKIRCHSGRKSNLFFWRDSTGLEVDVIRDTVGQHQPVEITAGATFAPDWLVALNKWLALAGPEAAPARIVYGGNMSFVFQGVQIVSWKDIHAVFADAVGNEIG
jgi:predicted AAA+ superfamily ATPase